jgi:hypothetical protein
MNTKMKEYSILFLISSVMIYLLVSILNTTSYMPDVHVSNSTGECVKVINYDERFIYNCSNYPSKYNHVWVK